MSLDRGWMYRRKDRGSLTTEFIDGVDIFIGFAAASPRFMNGTKIKCPCKKCKNKKYFEPMEAKLHLFQHGFIPNYHTWTMHGEGLGGTFPERVTVPEVVPTRYEEMVMDAGRAHFVADYHEEEPPNPIAQQLYDMLEAADRELWSGCANHTQLSLVARLMSLKSENKMSERSFDQLVDLIKEVVPDSSRIPDNFYAAKRLMRGMGLPVEIIDCCRNHCMLFWGADENLTNCRFCEAMRYKVSTSVRQQRLVSFSKMHYFPITPRLQRLYASKATAGDMRWHASCVEDGVMRHPADSLAWKHFNNTFTEFAAEPRNVRLGLCTDGFQPFNQYGKQYSSWPIVITPYNLPPWMCMREQHMFLTALVPGPHNPKEMIDVYLQPLIAELTSLWENGVATYDISMKNNFQMRAALMWTISDFPAYAMLSGWSTAGKLACPRCQHDTESIRLPLSGKQSWFDCHRRFLPLDHQYRRNRYGFTKNKLVRTGPPEFKSGHQLLAEIDHLGIKKVTEFTIDETRFRVERRQRIASETGWRKKSIFWDLPYWSSLLIRHNLDVMHIEKNVFDNIFNTVMNAKGKTKDTTKSRHELNLICRRPELQPLDGSRKFPKAAYTLDVDDKRILCKWLEDLKFPDGYASNIGRCVNLRTLQVSGLKSHDCHVMMQRILPVAFKNLLPHQVWRPITELCVFFKELTSPNLEVENLRQMNQNIPVILCKLEQIFPPSFFDSMEHLPIHLADEALLAGPVQYRWMYPFERYMGKLKSMVKNKAKVEGSMANAYLVEEAAAFCSYYFEDHVTTKARNVPRNFAGPSSSTGLHIDPECISVFKYAGKPFGRTSTRFLHQDEYTAAHLYVLNNCTEVTDVYMGLFTNEMRIRNPNMADNQLVQLLDNEFPMWFKSYVSNLDNKLEINVRKHNNLLYAFTRDKFQTLNPMNQVNNPFLQCLSMGPLQKVHSYQGYYVNGFKFHTKDYGATRHTNNSGVCVKGSAYSGVQVDFYGRLLEVLVIEYPGLPVKTVTLFKCEWFDPRPTGTSVDASSKLVSVNQSRRYNTFEPFILASQAQQVYYCTYPSRTIARRDWLAACKVKARPLVEIQRSTTQLTTTNPYQEDETQPTHPTTVDDIPTAVHPDGGLIEILDDEDDETDSDAGQVSSSESDGDEEGEDLE